MNIDQLRKQLPNEAACRQFFESIIWADGRVCPHCKCEKSYHLQGQSVRQGLRGLGSLFRFRNSGSSISFIYTLIDFPSGS